jgi:hypothetical protein
MWNHPNYEESGRYCHVKFERNFSKKQLSYSKFRWLGGIVLVVFMLDAFCWYLWRYISYTI